MQTSSLLYRRSANFVYRFSAFVKLRFSFICFLQISSLVYRYSAKLSLVYRRSANFVPINDFLQTSSQIYRFSSNLVTRLSAFIKLRFSFFGFLQTSSLVCHIRFTRLSSFCKLRHSFIDILQLRQSFIGVYLRHSFIDILNFATRLPTSAKIIGILPTSFSRLSLSSNFVYRHSAKLSLVYRLSSNFVNRLPAFFKLRHSFIDILQTSSLVYRHSANFVI